MVSAVDTAHFQRINRTQLLGTLSGDGGQAATPYCDRPGNVQSTRTIAVGGATGQLGAHVTPLVLDPLLVASP